MMTTKQQTTTDNLLLLNEDSSSSSSCSDDIFDDAFIDPSCFSNGEEFLCEQLETKPAPEVFLKPAKSRDDQYEGGPFPSSLLCNPYKYDVRVVGEIEKKAGPVNLTLDLVDSETLQSMQMPQTSGATAKTVQSATALTIESVTKVSDRERIIRFAFNLCSFHVQRKAFCLVVKNGDFPVFVSTSFRTYARRREHHNYSRPAPATTNSGTAKIEPRLSPHSSPEPQLAMVPPMPMYMCPPQFQPSNFQRSSPEMFSTLGTQERTSLAIQLMTSLSPMERQAVNFYLQSCGSVVTSTPVGYPVHYGMQPQSLVSNTIVVGGPQSHHHPISSAPVRFPKSR